jgi:hypothetical protein
MHEIALEFIESAEMREYLATRADCFDARICAEVIAASYFPLAKKAEALARLYKRLVHDEVDPKLLEGAHNPAKLAALLSKKSPEKVREYRDVLKTYESIKEALECRYSSTNAVFEVCMRFNRFSWEDAPEILDVSESLRWPYGSAELFTSYDAAVLYVKKTIAFERKGGGNVDWDVFWFDVYKWVPGIDGKMRRVIEYTLNEKAGEIYFSFFRGLVHDDPAYELPERRDINLPVPYLPGDIVAIDMSPYVEPFHAVIVTIADNADCCAIQAAWVNEKNEIDVGALKHSFHLVFALSPLYRLARFDGELAEREKPLYAISQELKCAPDKAEEVWERLTGD